MEVDLETVPLESLDTQSLLDLANYLGVVSNEDPIGDRDALIAIIQRQTLNT